MRWPERTPAERFWEKVDKSGSCWLWTAFRMPLGYGRFFDGETMVLAHRFAYELIVGPIPEGMSLDHLCRTPACVNPEHLEPVTHLENVRRGVAGEVNRQLKRAKTHCKRGHKYLPETTSVTPQGHRRCRVCENEDQRARRARVAA